MSYESVTSDKWAASVALQSKYLKSVVHVTTRDVTTMLPSVAIHKSNSICLTTDSFCATGTTQSDGPEHSLLAVALIVTLTVRALEASWIGPGCGPGFACLSMFHRTNEFRIITECAAQHATDVSHWCQVLYWRVRQKGTETGHSVASALTVLLYTCSNLG